MAATTIYRVNEACSARITGQFVDLAGANITLAQLTTLVGTLYNKATDAVITYNDANLISSVGAGGDLTLDLVPADNVIVDTTLSEELHILLLEWTWSSGTKSGKQEIHLSVKNLNKVP